VCRYGQVLVEHPEQQCDLEEKEQSIWWACRLPRVLVLVQVRVRVRVRVRMRMQMQMQMRVWVLREMQGRLL
jgi:hypothetical protein